MSWNQEAGVNPVLADLLANGSSLNSLPTDNAELSFTTSSAPATLTSVSATGTVSSITETFQANWFISGGILKDPYTFVDGQTQWQTSTAATTTRKTVVASVLRDGYGGEAVIVRML